TKSRSQIYKTISFGGDHVVTNTQLSKYWYKYSQKMNLKSLRSAQKEMDFSAYDTYLNNLYDDRYDIRASILNEMEANDTTLLFTKLDLEYDFSIYYTDYLNKRKHQQVNPEQISSTIKAMPSWKKSSLINSKFATLVNDMHFLVPLLKEQAGEDVFAHRILAYKEFLGNQAFLKELIINELVKQFLDQYEDLSEYVDIISPHILTPIIAEQINAKLAKVHQHIQDTDKSNKIKLDQILVADKDQIIQTLIDQHPNKVLYIDFWATYCAPCISEMMVSNDMHDQYTEKSVVFIYLCIDGKKRQTKWDKIVNGRGLKGHHIQLSDTQSNELMKALGFTAVPFYLILDQDGKLIEQGSHLRPSSGQSRIVLDKLTQF
ncbi:MAG: TlpA disulfide reductase family protein, partial [Bacteroidota bacterium]